MSDELALLAAIIANPDEDTPRLVFADYLDENGGGSGAARAEFIRTQIDITRIPEQHPYSPAYRAKVTRFVHLFAAHAPEWLEVVGVPQPRAIFRRGFVEEIRATAGEVLAIGAAALSREMLSLVEVVPTLKAVPDLDRGPTGDAVLRRLAEWPVPGRLRYLRLSALTLTAPAVRAFVSSPAASRLKAFCLYGCEYPDPAVREALAAADLPDLRSRSPWSWPF